MLSWLRRRFARLPVVTDDSPEHKDIIAAAEEQARAELFDAGVPVQIGYNEVFDAAKRSILREKYGLNWRPTKR